MLVTVALIAGQNQGVSTPLGRLNPGDAPISQTIRPERIEKVAADLTYLEAQGLISFTVADDPATDDRFQLMTRNAQSQSASSGGIEFQGEDVTFYVPLPAAGAGATEIQLIAPGKLMGKQLRILDLMVNVTTLQAGSSVQLFDTTGGVNALSSALTMTATGTVRHVAAAAFGLMTKAKGLYARRPASNSVGELVVWARSEY